MYQKVKDNEETNDKNLWNFLTYDLITISRFFFFFFQILNEDMTAAIFDLDGEGCSCTDCDLACKVPEFPDEADQEFVIVEGVDGVVFIMVIIFIVGSIIFLAIIVGSTVLEKNFVRKCLLRNYLSTLQFHCHGNQITRIFKKCLLATIFSVYCC